MYTRIITVILIALLAGCKKDKEPVVDEKTATELLTGQKWILAAAGFDDNKNGILDSNENTIKDCEKDNSYFFNVNGTGEYRDNQLLCGGVEENDFEWQLINNNTELVIDQQSIFIKRLDKDEMFLSPNTPWLNVPFMIIYNR
jgi:hypothetical protein